MKVSISATILYTCFLHVSLHLLLIFLRSFWTWAKERWTIMSSAQVLELSLCQIYLMYYIDLSIFKSPAALYWLRFLPQSSVKKRSFLTTLSGNIILIRSHPSVLHPANYPDASRRVWDCYRIDGLQALMMNWQIVRPCHRALRNFCWRPKHSIEH